jgi:hypothetical protein
MSDTIIPRGRFWRVRIHRIDDYKPKLLCTLDNGAEVWWNLNGLDVPTVERRRPFSKVWR